MNELQQKPQLNIPVVIGSAFIPSDFRIGNYVQSKEWKGIAQIEGIEILKDRIDFKVKGYIHSIIEGKYFDLEKITLTDELIQKLGFKRFESDGVVGFDSFEPEEKTIWYDKGKFTIVQWGENTPFFFSNHNLRIELKFVHQLQNLFYAVECSELSLS